MPIAEHLARAGHPITVFDKDPQRLRLAAERGLNLAPDAASAAASADIVITVLPGADEFADVMLGSVRVVERMRAGACWLDLTSNDPRVARRVAAASDEREVLGVGAPMGGGVESAAHAALDFYVGGTTAGRVHVSPILEVLARPDGIRFVGEDVGAGYSAKLLINLLWFGQVAAVTEALLLGQDLGIRPESLRGLIAGSAADSAFAQRHLDRLLEGDYIETFGLRECVEELEMVSALASETRSPFDVSTVVTRLHRDALQRFGPVDGEMLVAKLLEERHGAPLRRSAAPN